ncbi:MAG TPA: hypothetical protein VGA73_04835 [Candidatus Binatia bacterium]
MPDDFQIDTLGLPVNRDVLFTTHKNRFHKGAAKGRMKVLRDFAPALKQLLKPGEEILLVVKACSPMSWFEQMTTGWIIYYLKRCVLVVTNQRILHFPTRTNFAPRRSAAQILYGDIADIKLGAFLSRTLKLTYRSGKVERFHYIPPAEYKKLKAILPSPPRQGAPSEAGERHHLCPRCQARLLKGKFKCPSCHLQFKDGERAVRLSILYPGGGYFYTGHPLLGVGDALAEGVLLFAVFAALVEWINGGIPAGDWALAFFLGLALVVEKAETIYHAKHYVNEYIPLEDSFAPMRAPS